MCVVRLCVCADLAATPAVGDLLASRIGCPNGRPPCAREGAPDVGQLGQHKHKQERAATATASDETPLRARTRAAQRRTHWDGDRYLTQSLWINWPLLRLLLLLLLLAAAPSIAIAIAIASLCCCASACAAVARQLALAVCKIALKTVCVRTVLHRRAASVRSTNFVVRRRG